jgi:hypothetical protein
MPYLLAQLLSLLIFATLANPGFAASLLSGEVDVKRPAERLKAAQELLSQFDKLATLVQPPRPSESAWVQTEQAAITRIADAEASTSRSIQLLQAPEYQQENVYVQVQEVRNALRCIIDSPPSVQREVFCWAVASFLLNNRGVFYDGVLVLVRAKRLPDDFHARAGAASLDSLSFIYGLHSKSIQQYVVLPYLRGDFK